MLRSLICLSILLFASTGLAQSTTPSPELTLRLLPEYIPCTYKSERYACYTAEQQQALNLLGANAHNWKLQTDQFQLLITTQKTQIANLEKQVTLAEANDSLGRAHNKKLTDQLLVEIKKKNDWRAKAETPVVWPYLIGGSMAAIAVGVALGVYVSK